MIITTNQMKRIFDEFNYQVNAKCYQKMPRDDWRKIKTAIKDGRMFILNMLIFCIIFRGRSPKCFIEIIISTINHLQFIIIPEQIIQKIAK